MGLACTKTCGSRHDDATVTHAWTTNTKNNNNRRTTRQSQRLRNSMIFFSIVFQRIGGLPDRESVFDSMVLRPPTVVPFCLDASIIMHANKYTLSDVLDLFCTTNSSLLSISKTSIRHVEFNDHPLDWDLPLNWVPSTSLRDPILLICQY